MFLSGEKHTPKASILFAPKAVSELNLRVIIAIKCPALQSLYAKLFQVPVYAVGTIYIYIKIY